MLTSKPSALLYSALSLWKPMWDIYQDTSLRGRIGHPIQNNYKTIADIENLC